MAETAKLVNRIREISESLLCRDGVGHYCPNCGSTTFEAAMNLKLLADQIGSPVETSREPRSDAECLAAVPDLKGKNAVVLYFETPEDRDELVALIHEAKPGMKAVNL